MSKIESRGYSPNNAARAYAWVEDFAEGFYEIALWKRYLILMLMTKHMRREFQGAIQTLPEYVFYFGYNLEEQEYHNDLLSISKLAKGYY